MSVWEEELGNAERALENCFRQTAELRDENERLRAALRDIAADKYDDPASAAEVAKAALMASLPGIPGFPDGKGES